MVVVELLEAEPKAADCHMSPLVSFPRNFQSLAEETHFQDFLQVAACSANPVVSCEPLEMLYSF